MFQVLILSSDLSDTSNVVFEGTLNSILLPGKDGEFEILDFHKPIISRLKKGFIIADNTKEIPIRGGVAKMSAQRLVAFVDL